MPPLSVALEGLTKRFGPRPAVDALTLDARPGEMLFLLGPSGCGKTTTLRSIAGFVKPDSGRILFDGKDVSREPPHRRNLGVVFQNYALFPHLTAEQNVAYGLRCRKTEAGELRRRVDEALDVVRAREYRDRRPGQLSGGQQQRVALARALAIRPGALLLDEPLSNLDARLRRDLREEIRRVHQAAGATFVYVTHDQEEALALAGRVAVMNEGRLEQVGPPEEIYRKPKTRFVASFMGEANELRGVVKERSASGIAVDTPAGRLIARDAAPDVNVGDAVDCLVRPEWISLASGGSFANRMEGLAVERVFSGAFVRLTAGLNDGSLVTALLLDRGLPPLRDRAPLSLTFEPESVLVFKRS